jgi:Kae1-associated kinase Bud32
MIKISQGAEAIIYKNKNRIIKKRVRKKYRLKELDIYLRKTRTRIEERLLQKASRSSILTPEVSKIDDFSLELEFINGDLIRDVLSNLDTKKRKNVCFEIGKGVAKLHNNNIIHGDLTTSNMILKKDKVYFIDFGLGFSSSKIEDKATDIYLFKKALKSSHAKIWKRCFNNFFLSYKQKSNDIGAVKTRLLKIESRGRYKKI